jgi:hypothetical protein
MDIAPPDRWRLIRDVLVFQLRLGLDALRDLLLSPISLVAGLVDLVFGGTRFYAVLAAGRRTEAWIHLFGELDRSAPDDAVTNAAQPVSIDALVERMERLIVEQYERGGVTASAKSAIDRGLDAIGRRGTPPRP